MHSSRDHTPFFFFLKWLRMTHWLKRETTPGFCKELQTQFEWQNSFGPTRKDVQPLLNSYKCMEWWYSFKVEDNTINHRVSNAQPNSLQVRMLIFLYLFNKCTLNTFKVLHLGETKGRKIIALKKLSLEKKETKCSQIIIIQVIICLNILQDSTEWQRD